MTGQPSELGMRRIHWVRVTIGGGQTRAEVHGTGHRLPRTVAVPLATATALAARGVPVLVRRVDAPTTEPLAEVG